jgi:hypothetical protein
VNFLARLRKRFLPGDYLHALRAELRDLDSWIPLLERHIDEKRARRQQIMLELVDVDPERPDVVARRCGAL